MVKNSKYIIIICFMLISTGLWAQSNNSKFSPIQRDIEISRVTLENFLKKWEGEPLLNRIEKATGLYNEGKGVEFIIDAPNARIFLDGRFIMNQKDKVLMDTFYDEEIVRLQRDRLKLSVASFLEDFGSYLPKINDQEEITFRFEVKDPVNQKEESPGTSPKENIRTYQIAFAIEGSALQRFIAEDSSVSEIENSIKISMK
ncbi:hypothetical protein [Roseivirga sp.]|uniref:hypothetical protein n=1 Tax=Roseivirga sp. TaxID=1964215 RepID=UPI003B5250CE